MSVNSKYVARVDLPVPIDEAFAYHERPGCLQRLIPPWESVCIESSDKSLKPESKVVLKTKALGVPLRWVARHTDYDPPRRFVDVQESGPFAKWQHQHLFESGAGSDCVLQDAIDYQLPAGSLGKFFGGGKALRTIECMFSFRHRITRDDLKLKAKYPSEPLTIAVSGSTGLVGSSLCSLLTLLGHQVRPIVRELHEDDNTIAPWGELPSEIEKFEGVDVVVHLAGKSIASGRWSESVRKEIRDSRVEKTQSLCRSLAGLTNPPKTFICASATGLYGDRGDELLDEKSVPGDDFLAQVSQEWEAACLPAQDAGIRVVNARFGLLVSPQGGALEKMLLPAKLCGGALGNGKQWWSWMALDDALGAIVHAIHTESLSGGVNFVSPQPISNREFAKTLGQVIGRPALFPAPAPMLRLALGDMADALLLASTRVTPEKLIQSGYEFRFESLRDLLCYSLGKDRLESVA